MERIGLLNDISDSAEDIYQGRSWLDTDGQEHNGRLSYNRGLSQAMDIFRQVQSLVADDLEIVLLTEHV